MEKLEKYLERENSLNAYDNERFYKNGLRDGAKMMLEILKIDKFDNWQKTILYHIMQIEKNREE